MKFGGNHDQSIEVIEILKTLMLHQKFCKCTKLPEPQSDIKQPEMET